MPELFKLEHVLEIAGRANAYAREQIMASGSWPSINDSRRFKDINDAVADVRKHYFSKIKNTLVNRHHHLTEFDNTVETSSKYSLGNCNEFAYQALNYVSENEPHVRAEVYTIHGGDHVFLVLNKAFGCNDLDPTTWGPDAVICDPWADKVFMAGNFLFELKNFYRLAKDNRNYTENFNIHNHILQPKRNMNTDFIRRERWNRFKNESGNLINTVKAYKKKLNAECARLKRKYGQNDPKVIILTRKIDDVNSSYDIITKAYQEEIAKSVDDNYLPLKSRLDTLVKSNQKLAKNSMQLGKSDIHSLFAYRETFGNKKIDRIIKSLLRFFGKVSTTETTLRELTKSVNKSLGKKA